MPKQVKKGKDGVVRITDPEMEKVKKKNKDKTFQNLTVEQQIELLAIKAGIVKTDKVSDIK